LIEALLIAAVLVAFFRQRARLQKLEHRLVELEVAFRAAAGPQAAIFPTSPETAPLASEPAVEPAREEGPAEFGTGSPDPVAPESAITPVPPVRRPGFEERIGSRWAVWVGGLALGLGGLLLVRYSIEQDLIGPGLRVVLGSLLALGLIGAGEWLRRREEPVPVPAFANANIPAVLTAAGTSTAFAVIYAAYALYELIGPTTAFLLLGLVSIVTMAASALHGPALAGLGLVAALGSPLLVETQTPNYAGLVAYLACSTAASYAVARLRLWRWIAVAGAAGAVLWGIALTFSATDGVLVAHALVQLLLATGFLVADPHRFTPDSEAVTDRFGSAVLGAFALLAIVITLQFGHGSGRPLFAGATMLILLGAAFRFPAVAPAAAAAALVAIGTLLGWPVEGEAGAEPITVLESIAGGTPLPAAISTYLIAAFLLGAAVFGASLLRVARGPALRLPAVAWYLGAATLGPILGLVVVYGRVTAFDRSIPFALVAAALAAVHAGAARFFRGEEHRRLAAGEPADAALLAVGATAAAAIAALALGLTMALDRGVLTVSFALAALGTAFVAERAAVPALRYVVGGLGLLVAARMAWDPRIMGADLGATPIFNWLLFGYGVPAVAFWLSARILARRARDRVVLACETLAILFSALLVFLEIRHALHDGDIYASTSGHLEAGLVVSQGLCFSLLMARLASRRPHQLYRMFSLAFAALALLGAAATLFVFENPFFTGDRIGGGVFFNTLIPAYLIPAALAALLASASRHVHPRAFVLAVAAFALGLELAYACLEVRRLFQGPDLFFFRRTSDGELWSYSLVLLANGVALLAAGFLWTWREARLASAACILAAVAKVFILDLAGLEGLMRALSFVGLGLVLVGIGFAYQRLLARDAPPADNPA
jgi:uncharacterized membrane protein